MADREYPLTPGQERMWFLQQLDPDDVSENMVTLRLLDGALDPVALGRAVDGLVARHEPLRASFAATEQGAVQRVAERVTVPVRLTDVTDMTGPTGASGPAEALRLAQARGAEPYRLDAGPLLRVELFRTGEREHLLLLGTHHLVSDGWSVQLLLAELAAGYAAYVRGGSPETAPPAVGFGDHVMWQRARSAGPLADRALAHWSAELADPPGPGLPFCSPGEGAASTSSGSGHVVRARVPEELATAVAEAARARRCTPYMGWLALYQVLLARHTGRHDLVVGSPAAGRERSEDERLVGCFTAILPLRADLSGEVSFDALLDRTRRVVTGALTYPQVPYERLLATLGTARDAGQRRLFQSWFNLHTEAAGAGAGEGVPWSGGLLAREVESDPGPTPFATSLDAWPAHGGLDLVLGYDPADLDHATAAALVARLPLLAASAVAHPDVPVTRLSLLAPGERGALLWGPGAPEGREEPETVVGMLLRQAERTPDAVAVEADGRSLTYRQLVAGARRTAAELHRCGVPQGSPVGLLAGERSVESLIGLWGVLLAGCGYLPLDPALPSGRIGALVRGAGVSALLACDASGERPCLPGDVGIPVVVLPRSGPESTGHRAASDGLAYVLHTSGSTGEPKAVAVPHRALAARVRWMRQAYRLGAGDRVLQFAALDFDTHVEEVFPTLASGATLVLSGVPSAQLPDWLGTARARDLTVLDLPTAYWQELVAAGVGVSWPSALRTVILGGDQVEASSVAAWRRRFGDRVELWNTYGPTEATVIATAARLGAADALRRPGIGTPLSETGAYVLDAGREPVPTGVVGELWIAGAGLATGYLDADYGRFTADPYGPSGGRMYRTGDLARQRSDGTLEFLGRTDRQLKVRGRRVEPAEVEAALLRHPAVARALVDLHDADGRQTLVSWVVPAPTAVEASAALPGTLLGHLRGLLPAHLVPDAVVLLDRLPLTTRGKPDRPALPAPAGTVEPASGRVPPSTDAELLVAEVWAEVLGLAEVGAHDDFFALGGHSLLVVRVVARLRAALGLDLPVRTLFTFPTVAGTAVAVEDLILADIDGLTDAEVDAEVDALILEGPAR